MKASKVYLLVITVVLVLSLHAVSYVDTTSLSVPPKENEQSPVNRNLQEANDHSNNFRSTDRDGYRDLSNIQSDAQTSVDKSPNNSKADGVKRNRKKKNRNQKKGRGNRKGRGGEGVTDAKAGNRNQRPKANKNALRLLSRVAGDTIAGGGAFPPLSNIAPRARANVNATCGLNGHEEYCKLVDSLSHKVWDTQCGICDDNSLDENKRHPIETILDNSNTWWQSPSLQYGHQNEYVTITLDLRQPHQIFFIVLKAGIAPRPASWLLERSLDNITYETWQYFGLSDSDCRRRYNVSAQNGKYIFHSNTEIICSTQFSKSMPLQNGEIHISLLKNRPSENEQSQELLSFITARYIRIRLQGMHSTAISDNSVSWNLDTESLKKRSFYSLKSIKISGRLNCNGHAVKTMEVEDENGESFEQCVCLHDTCGVYCDKCCPLYNDQPYRPGTSTEDNSCKRCECNGHAKSCFYDEAVQGGVCLNCTNFTTGRHCESCIPGYYRPPNTLASSAESCVVCDCHTKGSTGDCDPETGDCVCRDGFTGRHCDECLHGYNGENCVGCSCDSRGTLTDGECEDPCPCKLYVEGDHCSSCAPGYFALREENPDGCLKCFCSGVAVTCNSYESIETTFETLDSWTVTDMTRTAIAYPSRENTTSNLVFALSELPDVEAVYWLAPKSYVGNRLESYGSKLVVQVSWDVIRGDTSGKPTSGPNVIIIGKNGAKIAYADEEFQENQAVIEIPLVEKGWYHVPKTVTDIVTRLRRTEYRGDPVTRFQFMSVMSEIETIMIRGTFHTDQGESILERATLYTGSSELEENEWSLVEECQCPPGYSGLSCESCTFGYVRIYENSTSHEVIGKCIPCGCNGHAESCDLDSGECGACVHNTFGERCERCKMGFYGNAMHGTPHDCKRCACPLLDESNNFSPSCQLKRLSLDTNEYDFENDEDYVCTQCPEGYIGDHCEQCDDGYYGNPLEIGSKCLPCPCSGGPCDPLTGECITCLGNTEGWRCERCQMGFWGDPTFACDPCNCNSDGATNNVCNPETGMCSCREKYTGQKCNECERGYTKSSLIGKFECVPCECNVNGSVDPWCDPFDGQCMCKFGVVGLKCDECQAEYYGLDATGCHECRCNARGSTGKGCNRLTGQCNCLPNVSGQHCNICEFGFWNMTAGVGCQECECHPLGSRDNVCDSETGHCVCKPGVTGYRCDRCIDGYYGLSKEGCRTCDRCPSDGYICDSETGGCICPINSKGPNCQHCQSNTWNWQPKIGCQNCDCDSNGSIGQTCDVQTGQCVCREGYTGRRCDSCAVGYYDYPNCVRCNCNIHGSEVGSDGLIQCDDRGQCPCKNLVTGLKCDICRQHTFGLHKSNVEGCTRCFCFQRSQQCTQSVLSWGLVKMQGARNLSVEYIRPEYVPKDEYEYVVLVQMEGSMAYKEDAEIQEMNSLSLIPSSTGNVSIGAYTAFYYPLYFQLPPQFYGDRTKSYGGYLRFSTLTGGAETPMVDDILRHFPLVQIHSFKNLVLNYYDEEPRNLSANESFVVPIHESYWKFHETPDEPVTRAAMMTALQHVRHIFLRATTWSDFTEIVLHSVRMDTALYLAGSTTSLAYGVEECECPSMYEGLSCQDPGQGYYRQRNDSSPYVEDLVGRAVSCKCNGRSDECDRETGVCLNCQQHSGGDHCERCADGYYGNPSIGECKSCPCPETSRNFAKGCSVWQGEVRCQCKPGYGGALCDTCAKGFFGLPSEANGRCEPCNCNPDGIVSDECDEEDGQCNCRPGVTGRKCDRCTMERHILEDRRCKMCDNCSLTLMDTVENIKNQLRRGIAHIDLTHIHAPYVMVDEYMEAYDILADEFESFSMAKDMIENYDGNDIERLLSKSEDLHINSRKQSDNVQAFKADTKNMLNNGIQRLKEAHMMSSEVKATIHALDNYGTQSSHTDPEQALIEVIPILNELQAHQNDRNDYTALWKLAQNKFEYFAKTSDIVQDQLIEMEKLSRNMSRFNHRISDIMIKTDETLETLREAGDVREHIVNLRNLIVDENGLIQEGVDDILKLLNNSFVTDAETIAGEIDNGLTQIEENNDNILNLRDLIGKRLNETDEQLKLVRSHWIKKARKYAQQLVNRAKEYADKFQTTKDGAKVALLASTAHQNISNAIHDARQAAMEAQVSAKLAQDKLFTTGGISLTDRGQESLQESESLQKNAIKRRQKMDVLQKTMETNENNVNAIKSTIRGAALKNNDLSLALEKLNNTARMTALQRATAKSDTISKDMRSESRKATALENDIGTLREKFASLEPDWESKLGMAEENVTEIQSNHAKAKNLLIKAENEARRAKFNFDKVNMTLSNRLQDLRDKIAKAKHAAEGIKVSLDSTSSGCIRSYLPPTYGLSTSNTIKITLALTREVKDSPLIYIQGNGTEFIALEMIKRQIRMVWNLGGRTGSVMHPTQLLLIDSKIDEAWYQVDANRTLNIGSLLVRRMTNSSTLREEKPAVSAATNHEDTRFVITSSDYIWIGGVPDNIRPKELQANPGLNVALHQVDVDGKPIGLWNFASDEDNKCDGVISGPIEASPNSNARYFNGEGYAELKKSRRPYRKNRFSLQMAFKTFDENALLFLAVDNYNNRSISITLSNGRIVFRIDYGGESKLEITTEKKYNTGEEIRLEAAREFVTKAITENGSLKVNGENSLNGSPTTPIKSAMLPDLSRGSYYLGGVPPGFRSAITKAPGAENPFMGCMMDVQINGESYDPLEGVTYFGVEQSCKTAIKNAGFYGNGYVELPSQSLYRRANAGFVFRTLQPECLLVLSAYPPSIEGDYDDLKGNYSISLIDGKVQVWIQTGRDQLRTGSNVTVNDGEYHVLNLIKNGRKIELMIDDERQWTKNLTGKVSMPDDEGGLYFGGAPDYETYKHLAPTFVPFEGTIQDVVFNNRTILFSDARVNKNVDIGRNGPDMGILYKGKGEILMKTEPIGKSFTASPEGCQRVGSYSYEPNAFKFGDGPFSHSQLNITVRNFWQKNFLIKFDFRSFYSNGVIFIAPGTKEKQKHFVVLLLKDGQLLLRVRGRKRFDLLLAAKLDDGQWHQVTISCQERKITMSVDIGDTGQRTSTQMKIPKRVSASNNMFVGGIPEGGVKLAPEMDWTGFKGCIRKMSINNSTKDLARPGKHYNVGQCFPKVEKGSYFPGDAYATYRKNFRVGKYLDVAMDFRTSELNGVLLSVSEPNGFPALSIELNNGNVVFSCDLGDGNPFRVESHFPSKYALCDNKWHNISTIYDAQQIELRIDAHPAIISIATNRSGNKVQTKSSLYIGGLPDIAPSGSLLSRENFKGCIRNVSIRNERHDWIEMESLHNVLLSECLAVS